MGENLTGDLRNAAVFLRRMIQSESITGEQIALFAKRYNVNLTEEQAVEILKEIKNIDPDNLSDENIQNFLNKILDF